MDFSKFKESLPSREIIPSTYEIDGVLFERFTKSVEHRLEDKKEFDEILELILKRVKPEELQKLKETKRLSPATLGLIEDYMKGQFFD